MPSEPVPASMPAFRPVQCNNFATGFTQRREFLAQLLHTSDYWWRTLASGSTPRVFEGRDLQPLPLRPPTVPPPDARQSGGCPSSNIVGNHLRVLLDAVSKLHPPSHFDENASAGQPPL